MTDHFSIAVKFLFMHIIKSIIIYVKLHNVHKWVKYLIKVMIDEQHVSENFNRIVYFIFIPAYN